MESFTTPTKPARQQTSEGPSHQMLAIYIDNFLLAAVEDSSGMLLK
jgi:hypothetical protein